MVLHEGPEPGFRLNGAKEGVTLDGLKGGLQCIGKMLLGGREECGHGKDLTMIPSLGQSEKTK
jgi:hypothetical protein